MHARVVEPFAPHVHDEFAVGVCTEGTELIRYRGRLHQAGLGSVVILEPGVPHTGGPEQPRGFVYRVMYPGTGLLAEGLRPGQAARPPRFRQPVVADPALAGELRRLHARLSRGAEPLEAESRLVWLLAALVDRHASGVSGGCAVRNAYGVAREVMTRLADQAAGPSGLTELAAAAGMSRYQLLRSFQAEVGMPPYAWLAQVPGGPRPHAAGPGAPPRAGRRTGRVRRPGPPEPVVPAGGRGDARHVLQQRSRQAPGRTGMIDIGPVGPSAGPRRNAGWR